MPTDLRYVDLDRIEVDASVLDVLPGEVATHHGAFPIAADPDVLFVALSNPAAEGVLRDLGRETGREVRPVLAERGAIERALQRHQGREVSRHLLGWFEEWRPPPARAVVRASPRRGRHDEEE